MGGNTLEGINKAIKKGASVEVTKGFKPRDLKIGRDSDLLIAFTWGHENGPKKDSGTEYTWNHSNAIVKKHIPLQFL